MSHRINRACLFAVLLLIGASTGCAGWRQKLLGPETVSQSREDRAAEAVREFEDRRDAAQLSAAIERLAQGDAQRAEAMLEAIVNRRPGCAEARLRLAEVLWSRNDAAAESHLRAVLEADATSAEAHHALGLVLDGTGRSSEARQHFQRAIELQPENEVFRATAESAK